MDHHIVADVDTHMADTGGVVGSGEKHQIARFDVSRGYRRTDVAKSLLEKIIYIADYMEPNRDFPGVDRLREAVWRDLDEGVLLGIDMTLEQLAQKGQPACADSLAARDWLIQTRKEP